MSLITAFEIITLAGIGLGLLAIAVFEVEDTLVDRQRRSRLLASVAQTPAQPLMATAKAPAVAANQMVDLPKAA